MCKSKLMIGGVLYLAMPAMISTAVFADPLALEGPGANGAPIVVAEAPTTQPAPFAPAPAPQPQAAVAVPQPQRADADPGRILVLPFQTVNPNETNLWIGKSIQQSLVADLLQAAPNRVATADQPAPTVDSAIALGRQNHARYVISGGFVSFDRDLRITGQVLDVDTGQPVTGLKVTGDPAQVFRLEDMLASEVKTQLFPNLPQAPLTGSNNQAAQPQAAVVAQPPATPYYSSYATSPPATVYAAPATTYVETPTYYTDPYAYGYPYYSYPYYGYYGYPYVGVGLGFYGGYGYRGGYGGHFGGGGFHGGGFGGGFHGGGGGGFHGGGGGGGHR